MEVQIKKLCKMCSRRARIIVALNNALPEEGFLFEMQDIFHKVVRSEV